MAKYDAKTPIEISRRESNREAISNGYTNPFALSAYTMKAESDQAIAAHDAALQSVDGELNWRLQELPNYLSRVDQLKGPQSRGMIEFLEGYYSGEHYPDLIHRSKNQKQRHSAWKAVYQDVLDRLQGKTVDDVINALTKGEVNTDLVTTFVKLRAAQNIFEVKAIAQGYPALAADAEAGFGQ